MQKGEKNNETVNPEISELNKYMESEDKASLDKEIAEWQYICGTAYRWVDIDNEDDEDEAPFEIRTADPRKHSLYIVQELEENNYFVDIIVTLAIGLWQRTEMSM